MADPTRKKNKGKDRQPSAQIIQLDISDPLRIITEHDVPYEFELSQFSNGRDTSKRKYRNFKNFKGRPQLIIELAPAIRANHINSAPTTCVAVETSLRWWWRFFDDYCAVLPVHSVADLDDIHYALYSNLGSEMPSPGIASMFFKLVNTARAILNQSRAPRDKLPPLLWNAREKTRLPEKSLVSMSDVRELYHYIKHRCFAAVHRYQKEPCAEPSLPEANAMFVMFTMVSGWNTSVVANINIAEDYLVPHPSNPQFSYVTSKKPRANDTVQFALSRNKSDISPANLLQAIITANAPLRNRLAQYHAELLTQVEIIRKAEGNPKALDKLRVKIGLIRRQINSPWLYRQATRAMVNLGTVAEGIWALDGSRVMEQNTSVLRLYAQDINQFKAPSAPKVATNINLRDLRDAFISWRWMTSQSWVDAMLAAGHTNRQSLVRYLKRKQIKQRSQREFIKVGDAVWQSIQEERQPGHPFTLALTTLAKIEKISPEQINRWKEGKDKTYVGTGCLDFTNPPKNIAPHHQNGKGCRIQRCTLCEYAILLPDSDNHLARRLAELRFQRRNISEQAWQQSTYPQEMQNTHAALEQFDPHIVAELVKEWELAILSGAHTPVTTEGAYA